jgi:hypothetical protein
MITPLPPLVAYRRDVAHLGDVLPWASDLDDRLTQWLAFASMLETLASCWEDPGRASTVYAQILETFSASGPEAVTDSTTLPSHLEESGPRVVPNPPLDLIPLVRRVADAAEQGGALWLANAMLTGLERIGDEFSGLEVGRILAQRARVARKADAADIARVLYKRVAKLGRQNGEPELTARAEIGFGVLAQVRGNLPLAARHFERAAGIAAHSTETELLWLAEHGRMVTAAKRGAFAAALRHGWTAFTVSRGNREREADMLLNLAQLAFDTGHPLPALHGFAAALKRKPGPHLTLPALGGAARAASVLGRADIVRWCADRLEVDTPSGSFAYPTASALLDVASALTDNLPSRARAVAERALELAERFGFHELEHHLRTLQRELELRETPIQAEPPATVAVGPQGDEVLRQIEQLEGELLGSTAT